MITPSHLLLSYNEWKNFIHKEQKYFSFKAKDWLNEWNRLDLSLSPMDDEERKHMRYGHYLGWFGREEFFNDFNR